MKHILEKGILTLLMVLMVAMAAPSILPSATSMSAVEAADVKISAQKATLVKGQTKKLKIKNTSSKVKWKSSKKSVATVNKNGKVTAKKKGTATITATVNGKKYTCKITVENPKISKKSATLTTGDTLKLKMSGTSQTVTWSSSKTSVAKVNKKGKVTAKKAGTATITAKIGKIKYKCKITVKDPTVAVTSISLNKTSSTLYEGDTLSLSATVSPSNATDKTITWSSSNSSVASVDSNGKVTAKKAGTAFITAQNGNLKCDCVITVVASAYNTLKNFLTSKGTKSGSNYSYEYADDECTLTITYSNSSDNFTFELYDKPITCKMSYNEDTAMITPTVENDEFSAIATFSKAAYSRQTLSFLVENTSSVSSSLIQSMSNTYVRLNLSMTQVFLLDEVGISLQDLGFTSYPT